MNIYVIAELSRQDAPYFFSRDSMRFFGQTMSGFRIKKMPDGRYRISQAMKDKSTGRIVGETVRYFNPENNKLELN